MFETGSHHVAQACLEIMITPASAFQVLRLKMCAIMLAVYNFLCERVSFLWCIFPRVEFLTYGNFMFHHLRKKVIFQSSCTILYSHQQCVKF
jgi:hypothetical protein